MRVQVSRIARSVCSGNWCYYAAAALLVLAVLIAILSPSAFTQVPDEQFDTTNGREGVIIGHGPEGHKPPGLGGRRGLYP